MYYLVSRHGAVVVRSRDLQASGRRLKSLAVLCCAVLCCAVHGIVLLGEAHHPHMHSLNPGVSGYLVGLRRLVCVCDQFCGSKLVATRLYAPQGVQMAYE